MFYRKSIFTKTKKIPKISYPYKKKEIEWLSCCKFLRIRTRPFLSDLDPAFSVGSGPGHFCRIRTRPFLSDPDPAFSVGSGPGLFCRIRTQPFLSDQDPAFSVGSVAFIRTYICCRSRSSIKNNYFKLFRKTFCEPWNKML